jgi:hypothetical protein
VPLHLEGRQHCCRIDWLCRCLRLLLQRHSLRLLHHRLLRLHLRLDRLRLRLNCLPLLLLLTNSQKSAPWYIYYVKSLYTEFLKIDTCTACHCDGACCCGRAYKG